MKKILILIALIFSASGFHIYKGKKKPSSSLTYEIGKQRSEPAGKLERPRGKW